MMVVLAVVAKRICIARTRASQNIASRAAGCGLTPSSLRFISQLLARKGEGEEARSQERLEFGRRSCLVASIAVERS